MTGPVGTDGPGAGGAGQGCHGADTDADYRGRGGDAVKGWHDGAGWTRRAVVSATGRAEGINRF